MSTAVAPMPGVETAGKRDAEVGLALAVLFIVALLMVPLPGVHARPVPRDEHRHVARRAARRAVHDRPARVQRFPVAAAAPHAVPSRAQRLQHAAHSQPGTRGRGHPGVRRVRDRRQLRRRAGALPDPHRHQLHRHHEGRRPRRRSRGALHVGRDARQADGDRRRSERRPDRREAGAQAPRRDLAPGGLLRRDGRLVEVREGRRDRRTAHHGDQHRRRHLHRRVPARTADRPGAVAVHDPHGRRRSRHADPGADHQHRRRHHGDARGRRHAHGLDARHAARARIRARCTWPAACSAAFGLVPGLPKIPFFVLGGGLAALGRVAAKAEKKRARAGSRGRSGRAPALRRRPIR